MFKSLLLAIDHSEYSYVTTRYAVEWAKGLEAHLNILSVLDQKELAVVYPFIFPQEEVALDYDPAKLDQELRSRQLSQAQQAIEKAERACIDAGVSYSAHTEEGIVSRIILQYALDSDLLVIGRRGSGAEHSTAHLGSNIESVVRQIHRPVLITPHSYRPFVEVLAAYDGSPSSSEALHTVVGICDSWSPSSFRGRAGQPTFHMLVVSDDAEDAKNTARRAHQYLDAYALESETVYESGEAAEAILRAAEQRDVDLIAMGAYGHSRVRQMLLGCVTERVLRLVDRPLLLIH